MTIILSLLPNLDLAYEPISRVTLALPRRYVTYITRRRSTTASLRASLECERSEHAKTKALAVNLRQQMSSAHTKRAPALHPAQLPSTAPSAASHVGATPHHPMCMRVSSHSVCVTAPPHGSDGVRTESAKPSIAGRKVALTMDKYILRHCRDFLTLTRLHSSVPN